MSRSDLSSLEQRPVDWDMEDQARCWEDQRRDEEELQQMRREAMREQIKREVVQEFLAEIKPQIDEVMVKWGRRSYATGFLMGFGAALCGAVLFIYFS
jgi:hypothetical protein